MNLFLQLGICDFVFLAIDVVRLQKDEIYAPDGLAWRSV